MLKRCEAEGEGIGTVENISPDAIQDDKKSLIYKAKIKLNEDRKSTRLNSSHHAISYAVFCLKKKKIIIKHL